MISDVHMFRVWHPRDGLPTEYREMDFHFAYPISRANARDIVTRMEGFLIKPVQREKKTGPYIKRNYKK